MSPTYRELKQRIHQLEEEAEQARRGEIEALLADMRAKIREYGITPEQLFDLSLSTLVRYRDPETGRTWNGNGRPPDWIRGKDHERYRVK